MEWVLSDLSEVYQLIFAFPKLKYIKCSADRFFISVLLAIATDEQFRTIEYFVINHNCTLISYTLELFYLILRVITFFEDKGYLDGDRWEGLISDYLPEVEEFHLEYHQQIDPESGYLTDF
ncbi:unnamed protein product [Rotaria sp. Silwood1]|nr:unnamed protein product [Rotaria sp. Silwood1]CAF1595216.1 unnamed protein product [Rotaria sp. Silwood1]CAF3680213.1 unnamed protein product [Rotaria sp. Silwood1]CAF4910619.1 unnamed protein product [Rotaria sp. Silwood1]